MFYSSRDLNHIQEWGLTRDQQDNTDEKEMLSSNIDKINKELAQLKKVFGKVLEKDPLSVLT